jgi:hypothetical protein
LVNAALVCLPHNQDTLTEINITLAALGNFALWIRRNFATHGTLAAYGIVFASLRRFKRVYIFAQYISLDDLARFGIPIGIGSNNYDWFIIQ